VNPRANSGEDRLGPRTRAKRAPSWHEAKLRWLLLLLALAACDDDVCVDGTCVCEAGESCEFGCDAPPCHATCEGDNPSCEGECANGSCTCGPNSDCDFHCVAPPCHLDCDEGSTCRGECANGNCSCATGAECHFACNAPPCHVACEGNNPSCTGVCANGSCTCGAGSSCEFDCASGPCHASCEGTCLVHCPPGTAGTQNCDISSCAAGEAVVCESGAVTACGVPCP
jgi:hypothetical protein